MGETTLYHHALKLEREGDFAGAQHIFQECSSDPTFDEGDLYFHVGWCVENEGKSAKAVECYNRAVETTRNPEIKLNSYFRAGWVLMHEKEMRGAGEMFRFAVEYAELVRMTNPSLQHAMFWYAHCLEMQGQYLEALKWYRIVQGGCDDLDPESRLRQIICQVRIGQYTDALKVCKTFESAAPDGFDEQRYDELQSLARQEREILEQCLRIDKKVSVYEA